MKSSFFRVIFVSKSMQSKFDLTFKNNLMLAVTCCQFLKSYSMFMFLFESILKRIKDIKLISDATFKYA